MGDTDLEIIEAIDGTYIHCVGKFGGRGKLVLGSVIELYLVSGSPRACEFPLYFSLSSNSMSLQLLLNTSLPGTVDRMDTINLNPNDQYT